MEALNLDNIDTFKANYLQLLKRQLVRMQTRIDITIAGEPTHTVAMTQKIGDEQETTYLFKIEKTNGFNFIGQPEHSVTPMYVVSEDEAKAILAELSGRNSNPNITFSIVTEREAIEREMPTVKNRILQVQREL